MHALFCGTALAKGLRFECNARIASAASPVGDRLRIKQVLVNLLSNALKFTAKGSVCLDIELRMHDAARATLTCQVRDTGMGTAGPLLTNGKGLGLAISQNLLQLMGSDLEFESHAGQGSLFRFAVNLALQGKEPGVQYMPLRRGDRLLLGALTEALQREGQSLRGQRVLIADDNPVDQRVLQEFLGMAGMQTTVAANGHEVLKHLQQAHFDALVLDTQMPDMGGVEVARRIAAMPGTSTMQIIALTADSSPLALNAYRATQVTTVLSKPADPLALLKALSGGTPAPDCAQPSRTDLRTWDLQNLRLQLGYHEETVQNLLCVFRRQALLNYHAITKLIGSGHLNAAAALTHTLSGAAGNIGALALNAAASDLVIALQTGSMDASALDHFTQTFEQTLASIPMDTRPLEGFTAINTQELRQDLLNLDLALSEQYFIPHKTFEKIRRNLSPGQCTQFDLVCETAQDMRYPQARQMLQALLV